MRSRSPGYKQHFQVYIYSRTASNEVLIAYYLFKFMKLEYIKILFCINRLQVLTIIGCKDPVLNDVVHLIAHSIRNIKVYNPPVYCIRG